MGLAQFLLFFIGGGLGTLARAGICRCSDWGVVLVNLLGCLLIGLVVGKYQEFSWLRAAVITGFLGGFTTYSAFALEALTIWRLQGNFCFVAYLLFQLVGGLACVWSGLRLAQWV